MSAAAVLGEVLQERHDQDARWGEQNYPDGTAKPYYVEGAKMARQARELALGRGIGTWADILSEEFAEALAESDESRLRAELVQVAAVAVAWVEAIDRRKGRL